MRNEIYYFNSATLYRKLINLCDNSSAEGAGTKPKFYILPDRQMSFLKILILPAAPKNKLKGMIRFQMGKIYPGNPEDLSFDFIPFKTKEGWNIVLYILKKKYMNIILNNKSFDGVVLPLQLLSKKEIQGLSGLIIFYPDMVETWEFADGIPEKIERHGTNDFSVRNSLILKNERNDQEKLMIIYPYNKTPTWDTENLRTKKFSETIIALPKDAIYFPEYRVTKKDRITIPIVITAFIISLLLLSQTALKYREFIVKELEVNTWIESVRIAEDQNNEALKIIPKLENELSTIRGDSPINVYKLLLRTRKAINSNSTLMSFGLKGSELTLTLRSITVLRDLAAIKDEFGNVRASSIRTLENGNKSYTAWVEIEPMEINK